MKLLTRYLLLSACINVSSYMCNSELPKRKLSEIDFVLSYVCIGVTHSCSEFHFIKHPPRKKKLVAAQQ